MPRWPVAGPSGYLLLASNPATKVKVPDSNLRTFAVVREVHMVLLLIVFVPFLSVSLLFLIVFVLFVIVSVLFLITF